MVFDVLNYGNKVKKTQAKVLRKTKVHVQSQQKNFEKFKL